MVQKMCLRAKVGAKDLHCPHGKVMQEVQPRVGQWKRSSITFEIRQSTAKERVDGTFHIFSPSQVLFPKHWPHDFAHPLLSEGRDTSANALRHPWIRYGPFPARGQNQVKERATVPKIVDRL